MVTHPEKKVDTPKIIMLEVRTALVPYLSISHPTIGETNDDAMPPILAAAAIVERFHPKSCAIGYMNIASIRAAAAFLATWVDPAAPNIIQP